MPRKSPSPTAQAHDTARKQQRIQREQDHRDAEARAQAKGQPQASAKKGKKPAPGPQREEPAPPLDYAALNDYAGKSRTAVATGENLFSFDDARNLLRYGGLRPERDFVQVDPLLSYGVGEYVRILELFSAWDRRHFLPHAGHLFAEAAEDKAAVSGDAQLARAVLFLAEGIGHAALALDEMVRFPGQLDVGRGRLPGVRQRRHHRGRIAQVNVLGHQVRPREPVAPRALGAACSPTVNGAGGSR